ncbi:prohibitin family protein [Polyangium mundeleinium]|uniref:Prohibitin family protein n=1 Tax=Polyangium mundeleinium TaxID=2995306 RepID=A0ABT5F1X2_9BACT|nr:prohibitin family protein [Polyangium mundeleinium]MDC0747086.1 prohibitin family protein [Polyangium mundeleinium]
MTERDPSGDERTNDATPVVVEPAHRRPEDPSLRVRLLKRVQQIQFYAYTTLVLVLLVLGFLWPRIFISVPAGSHAVMYRFFKGGTVTNRVWPEGLNVIPPWDRLTVYETRLQQQTLEFNVLSEEGLDLGVKVSIRYRPNKEMLGFLHQDIGTEYFERLIKPEVESHVRRTFGSRSAHEIYSSTRDVLQELGQIPVLGRLEEEKGKLDSEPYVLIQELKLVAINLPDIVEQAIADKYKQEQLMLEYRYKLQREENEAERKRTEAAGIRDYNLIVAKVNPDLLRWRSIEATLELAKSQNSKVVVLGGGQGAQMLLNVETAMGGSPSAATPPEPAKPVAAEPAPPPAQEPAKVPEPAAAKP